MPETLTRRDFLRRTLGLGLSFAVSEDIKPVIQEVPKSTLNNKFRLEKMLLQSAQEQEGKFVVGDTFWRGDPNKPIIYLTFDDCNDPGLVARIYKTLDAYEVRGTFFPNINGLNAGPDIFRGLHASGHSIENHTADHFELTTLSTENIRDQVRRQFYKVREVLEDSTYDQISVRLPYLAGNQTVQTVINSMFFSIASITYDTQDWTGRPRGAIAQGVIKNFQNGMIVLMHANSNTWESLYALPSIIEAGLNSGYQFQGFKDGLAVPYY